MSGRLIPALAIFCLFGIAISGCGTAPVTTESAPLTAADKVYLHNLGNEQGVTLDAQTQNGWVAVGHGICNGFAKDGVGKYMSHVGIKHYPITLAVAPQAIAAYCPASSAAYERWRKSQP